MSSDALFLGIDVGSTTVKIVVLNEQEEILYSSYQRHMSDVRRKIIALLQEVAKQFPNNKVKAVFRK